MVVIVHYTNRNVNECLSLLLSFPHLKIAAAEQMFGDLGGSQYVPDELKDFLSQLEADDLVMVKETKSED
jgi:hypothetical protein